MKIVCFDLDRTLWNCFDRNGNPIWAKQLLPPFNQISAVEVGDDLGAFCKLNAPIFSLLMEFIESKIPVCFLSVGAIYDLPTEYQPSINLLKLFGLFDSFLPISQLKYKTYDKVDFFMCHGSDHFVLIDDSADVLKSVSKCPNCVGISSLEDQCGNTARREVFG